MRAKYADFLSDTAEGRTALEAAKRIESRLDEKRATIEHAFETLKNERLLLRQERQAVHTLQGMIFEYFIFQEYSSVSVIGNIISYQLS